MTIDSSHDSLTMGISFAMSAPLSWRPAEAGLSLQQCEENERLLRIILALEEHPVEHSEELAMLDLKVNIIMDLLADLLTRQAELPAAVDLRMGAMEVIWHDAGALPVPDERIELSIYLHHSFPRPLKLRGRVQAVEAGSCHVHLDGLPENLQDVFEKFIFAHHRREVAFARHTQQ